MTLAMEGVLRCGDVMTYYIINGHDVFRVHENEMMAYLVELRRKLGNTQRAEKKLDKCFGEGHAVTFETADRNRGRYRWARNVRFKEEEQIIDHLKKLLTK